MTKMLAIALVIVTAVMAVVFYENVNIVIQVPGPGHVIVPAVGMFSAENDSRTYKLSFEELGFQSGTLLAKANLNGQMLVVKATNISNGKCDVVAVYSQYTTTSKAVPCRASFDGDGGIIAQLTFPINGYISSLSIVR